MIGEPACHDVSQPAALLLDRRVPMLPQALPDLAQLDAQAVAARLSPELEASLPRAPTDVGEAEEVEHFRLAETTPLAVRRRVAAELDEACLVRMQLQREVRQALRQFADEPLGLVQVLKADDDVSAYRTMIMSPVAVRRR
jgi:hypothetical protein